MFGGALAAAETAGLDLTGARGNRQMGNRDSFGFTAAVRNHGAPAVLLGKLNGLQGFGERADLIGLDKDSVGSAKINGSLQTRLVGNQQIVANELEASEPVC